MKKLQDIKPIIIEDDDDQDISNLNKDNVVTNKDVTSHIKPPKVPDQVYSQPNVRPPCRPPDLSRSYPKVMAQIENDLDFEENSPH